MNFRCSSRPHHSTLGLFDWAFTGYQERVVQCHLLSKTYYMDIFVDDLAFSSTIGEHVDWLADRHSLSEAASNAASHRERLSALRKVFLTSNDSCWSTNPITNRCVRLAHLPFSSCSTISSSLSSPDNTKSSDFCIKLLHPSGSSGNLSDSILSSMNHILGSHLPSVYHIHSPTCPQSNIADDHDLSVRAHESAEPLSTEPLLRISHVSCKADLFDKVGCKTRPRVTVTSAISSLDATEIYANHTPVHRKVQSPHRCQHQRTSTNGKRSNKALSTDVANWFIASLRPYADRLETDFSSLSPGAQLTWHKVEHAESSNNAMAYKPDVGTRAIRTDRTHTTWKYHPTVEPTHAFTGKTSARQSPMYYLDDLEYSDGSENQVKQRHSGNTDLDRKLLIMDETLRDFTSHLSKIDSTLGQMKSFGSLGQYLDSISNKDASDKETERRLTASPLAVRNSSDCSSSSSESGKSFECYPPSPHRPATKISSNHTRASAGSSSLGTSLTTLSSVWSSLSPAGRNLALSNKRSISDKRASLSDHPIAPFHSGGFRLTADVGSCSSSFTEVPSSPRHFSMTRRLSSRAEGRDKFSKGYNKSPRKLSGALPESKSDSDTSGSTFDQKGSSQVNRRYAITRRNRPRTSHSDIAKQHHLSSPDLPTTARRRSSLINHRDSIRSPSGCPNFYPDSGSSSSSDVQTNKNAHRLTQRLLRLLQCGRERDARYLIGSLLTDSTSRLHLAELIARLSSRAINVNKTDADGTNHVYANSLERSSSNSLLRLAQSLAALTDRTGRFKSGESLTSSRSHSRTPISDYAFSNSSLSVPFDLRHRRRHGSGLSLASNRSIHFVQWPSDAPTEERLPSMRPKPRPTPPSLLKSSILPPPDVLKRLDAKAVEVASTDIFLFTDLIGALTKDLTDEVCIIRALFYWIVATDLRLKEFDPAAPPESLLGTLRRVQTGQLMYNELCQKLCRFAGIHSHFITGYFKGTGYRPGMPLKNNQLFYSGWLAVHVGGGWRFLNVDSALRMPKQEDRSFLKSGRGSLTESVESGSLGVGRFCDEFYFLTDPEQHIFTSFPDQKAWQLLHKPIGIERFIHLPLLRSAFFNACLSLKKNYGDCLVTSNGQVTLKLIMPQFVAVSCSLENGSDHSILRGLCLVEVLETGDLVRIQVAPSQPGKYYLHIFVAPDWRRENIRDLACSFKIHCSEHNYERLIVMGRLPELGFLGPTPEAKRFGVSMYTQSRSGRSFIIHSTTEPLKIPFAIPPGLKVCHQLKSFDRPGHQMVDCDSYALLQTRLPSKSSRRSTGPNSYYIIRMPVEGFYYLTVYASLNSDLESDHLECAYRVLIDVRRTPPPSLVHAFPRQTYWWVQCRLHEPLVQRLKVDRVYQFRLDAPQCDSVAVVLNEKDWVFLTCTNSLTWSGKVNVGGYLGEVSVFGRFRRTTEDFHPSTNSDASNAYVKLLDYVVVE